MTGEVAKGEIMREVFQTQLQEVQVRLVEMAEDTVTIIEKATKAFTESNVALAQKFVRNKWGLSALARNLHKLHLRTNFTSVQTLASAHTLRQQLQRVQITLHRLRHLQVLALSPTPFQGRTIKR